MTKLEKRYLLAFEQIMNMAIGEVCMGKRICGCELGELIHYTTGLNSEQLRNFAIEQKAKMIDGEVCPEYLKSYSNID